MKQRLPRTQENLKPGLMIVIAPGVKKGRR
jgi:hypothetical protein